MSMTLDEIRAADYEYRHLPADFGEDGYPEIAMRWFACVIGSDPPVRLDASFGTEEEAKRYVADIKAGVLPRIYRLRWPRPAAPDGAGMPERGASGEDGD